MDLSQKLFSFELFPPKTAEGMEKLKAAVAKLNQHNPEYFSVTYGAGGSTQERTFATVEWLCQQGITTAPHLSCIGSSKQDIRSILQHYQQQGIQRLIALRGDLPSGMGAGEAGDFRYGNELVQFIREETGQHFRIEVAAYPEFHPQSRSASSDLHYFKCKVDAGADAAITQYFYNVDAYFAFLDQCQGLGIDIPIIPGIMPITNFVQLARFSSACGAEIPRWLRWRLEDFAEDLTAIRSFGEEIVTKLCERLLQDGAPGLHFYTMNQAEPTLAIGRNLSLVS